MWRDSFNGDLLWQELKEGKDACTRGENTGAVDYILEGGCAAFSVFLVVFPFPRPETPFAGHPFHLVVHVPIRVGIKIILRHTNIVRVQSELFLSGVWQSCVFLWGVASM